MVESQRRKGSLLNREGGWKAHFSYGVVAAIFVRSYPRMVSSARLLLLIVSFPITSSKSGVRTSVSAEAESERMTGTRALNSEMHGEVVDEVAKGVTAVVGSLEVDGKEIDTGCKRNCRPKWGNVEMQA